MVTTIVVGPDVADSVPVIFLSVGGIVGGEAGRLAVSTCGVGTPIAWGNGVCVESAGGAVVTTGGPVDPVGARVGVRRICGDCVVVVANGIVKVGVIVGGPVPAVGDCDACTSVGSRVAGCGVDDGMAVGLPPVGDNVGGNDARNEVVTNAVGADVVKG